MQQPDTPLDETRRLQALRSLSVLDTFPEERFDRFTRLAARLFDVPIALVSLVDRDRQWFKSNQGLDVAQTSREVSFCAHAILGESPLVVRDSRVDERFADNPLVCGAPGIRFYAGHLLHAPDGSRVGTLCIMDRQPREFSAADSALLADLASMVDRELSLLALATIDELTKLSNRRGFLEIGTYVLALCQRHAMPAALVAFDLDGFKQINDTRGHAAGDEVLRIFGGLLLKHFRLSDVIARFGGDEFCVLSSGASAEQLARSLEDFAAGFPSSALGKAHPALSWSCGVVDFDPACALDLEALLQAADQKMYDAKRLAQLQRRVAARP